MNIHYSQAVVGPHDLAALPDDLRSTPLDDHAALVRAANRIRWSPSARARSEFTQRARAEQRPVAAVQRDILVAGIQRALEYQYSPQTVRLGSAWIVDDDGHEVAIVPAALRPDHFARWLAQEARAAAESVALHRPYPLAEGVIEVEYAGATGAPAR